MPEIVVSDSSPLINLFLIGILLRAKFEKKIPTIKNELNLLRMKGFWIGKEIYEKVLREAGE